MEKDGIKFLNFRELFGRTGDKSFLCRTWGSMKNALIGSSVAVVFGLAILALSLFSVAAPASVRPFEGEQTKVEYYLPYPGILPDSPLYVVKTARDWVWLRTTWDQRVRAERELMLADKRINAAMFLTDGGKTSLGAVTAAKAQKYLEEAAGRISEETKKGRDVKSDLLELEKAMVKHAEILVQIKPKLKDDDLELLTQAMNTNNMTQQIVKQTKIESF